MQVALYDGIGPSIADRPRWIGSLAEFETQNEDLGPDQLAQVRERIAAGQPCHVHGVEGLSYTVAPREIRPDGD